MRVKNFEISDNSKYCENEVSCVDRHIYLMVEDLEKKKKVAAVTFQNVIEEGRDVPMKLEILKLPQWFEVDKFNKGQNYFYNNYYAMFVAKLCGLLVVLTIPSILKILVLTGKSSTSAKAFRRYIDTISNMLDWYDGDPTVNNNKIYRVLISVRGKHCAAATKSVTNGTGFICQRDLALTQFGFMGFVILKGEFFGIKGTVEEVEGFLHFWRTIGYFMGIDDRYNICTGTIEEVTKLCQKLAENIFKPALVNPPENFQTMSDALLIGMKPVVPFLSTVGFVEFTRRVLELPSINLNNFYAKIMLSFQIFVHTVLLSLWWTTFILRPILNFLLRFSIYANIKFPLLALLTLGKNVWNDSAEMNNNKSEHNNAHLTVAQ